MQPERPSKSIFPPAKIEKLKRAAIEKVTSTFLPNEKILSILLMGSSVKGTFGQYDPPGFRGSLFSDFDFIFFVEDDYEIPSWLPREPDGKPFADNSLNLAYRCKQYVDSMYDVEIFFIRAKSLAQPALQQEGERAGIPMTAESKNPFEIIYKK